MSVEQAPSSRVPKARSRPRLRIETIETLSGLRALEREWRGLEPRMPALPFVSFDWVEAWWEHLHADRLALKDELFVRLFRDAADQLVGIVPLVRTRRPGRGPLHVRHVQYFGADPNITEIRTLVAAPEQVQPVLEALLDDLHANASDWDFMQLTGVPAEHAEHLDFARFASGGFTAEVCDYQLDLPPTWEELRSRLPRNIKESLRKGRNAPKRDGLTLELVVVAAPELVGAALSDFFRLHEARSRVSGTVEHANVFAEPRARAFLRDFCERLARRDRLRIFQLRHGAAVVATRLGFVCGDCLYLYYSGFDPEYGRYSVMTTTVAAAIEFAISAGFRTVNLSTGADVSKLRWNPRQRCYREALLVSPSVRGGIAHESYAWARRKLHGCSPGSPLLAYLSR